MTRNEKAEALSRCYICGLRLDIRFTEPIRCNKCYAQTQYKDRDYALAIPLEDLG